MRCLIVGLFVCIVSAVTYIVAVIPMNKAAVYGPAGAVAMSVIIFGIAFVVDVWLDRHRQLKPLRQAPPAPRRDYSDPPSN